MNSDNSNNDIYQTNDHQPHTNHNTLGTHGINEQESQQTKFKKQPTETYLRNKETLLANSLSTPDQESMVNDREKAKASKFSVTKHNETRDTGIISSFRLKRFDEWLCISMIENMFELKDRFQYYNKIIDEKNKQLLNITSFNQEMLLRTKLITKYIETIENNVMKRFQKELHRMLDQLKIDINNDDDDDNDDDVIFIKDVHVLPTNHTM